MSFFFTSYSGCAEAGWAGCAGGGVTGVSTGRLVVVFCACCACSLGASVGFGSGVSGALVGVVYAGGADEVICVGAAG